MKKNTIVEERILLEALKIRREKNNLPVLDHIAVNQDAIRITDLNYWLELSNSNQTNPGLYGCQNYKLSRHWESSRSDIDPAEFPIWPELQNIQVIQLKFDNLPAFVPFMSQETLYKKALCGVMFFDDRTVATDGHKLRQYNCKNKIIKPFTLDSKYLRFLQFITDKTNPVNWQFAEMSGSHYLIVNFNFTGGNGNFICRVYAENMPDAPKVADSWLDKVEFTGKVTAELQSKVDIYKHNASADNYPVLFTGDSMYIKQESRLLHENYSAPIFGAYNLMILSVCLKNMEGADIKSKFNQATYIIKNNVSVLLMPIRKIDEFDEILKNEI